MILLSFSEKFGQLATNFGMVCRLLPHRHQGLPSIFLTA